MGDKLRNAIALSCDWTEEEVSHYNKVSIKRLGPVYFIEGLSKRYPAERARYLDKKLEIADGGKEERHLLAIAQTKGRALALRELEEIAFERFF